jgi:hypothetical protein
MFQRLIVLYVLTTSFVEIDISLWNQTNIYRAVFLETEQVIMFYTVQTPYWWDLFIYIGGEFDYYKNYVKR